MFWLVCLDWRGTVDGHHPNASAIGEGHTGPLETTSPPSQISRIPELTATAPPSTGDPGTTSEDCHTCNTDSSETGSNANLQVSGK